jgi:hypothetical protein
MPSDAYCNLLARVQTLKRRFLPQLKATGLYTQAQQDNMRALRLLVHAEIEHYLEDRSLQLSADLEQELQARRGQRQPVKQWARVAVTRSRVAVSQNNGVTQSCIKAMFEDLGLCEEVINERNSLLLDRLTTFGRRRGDVAHQSAVKATYQLNRAREEATINEVMELLRDLEALINERRLLHALD